MTSNDDEDDALEQARDDATHWRNAYWAQVRARDNLIDAAENLASYGSDYRAVRGVKGGEQTVHAADVSGSYDYCWCGLPADHDWPGKNRGRRHPKAPLQPMREGTQMPEPEAPPRIERRELRTYHEDLIDVIVRAVNDYHVRYRLTRNSILLYPPDGSTPFTIYARNSDRQAKTARKWFIAHVLADDGTVALVKDPDRILEDMDMRERTRELAEKLNSEEHEVSRETSDQKRARKARERTEAAEKMAEQAQARIESATQPPPAPPRPPGVWRTFTNKQGGENPNFEINDDGIIRCVHCGWATKDARGLGGHFITHHDPDHQQKLWGAEASVKKAATSAKRREERAQAKMLEQVEYGLVTIAEAVGVTLAGDTSGLEKQVAELQELLAIAEQERDEAVKARDEAVAARDEVAEERDKAQGRLTLLREALGG